MGNFCIAELILSLIVIAATPILVHGTIAQDPEAIEEWFRDLPSKKENVTKIRFYFQDIVSGKNATALRIAQSNITSTSPTFFGALAMIDDALTVGPEPDSKIIGRAQGLYGLAGLKEADLMMNMNLVFTDGYFNGSTLSVAGWNPVFREYREMPIVGGSGVFRLARGIATAHTHFFNLTTGDAAVEYNVIVIHY